ncbi:MAG TPA: hypothetical protein VEL76_42385 [Gemmataceae bacterium]|nr:hypothetical protein [Gemmataceae bacterium]
MSRYVIAGQSPEFLGWRGALADVEMILSLAPACTVGVDSAESDGGVLKILAREG